MTAWANRGAAVALLVALPAAWWAHQETGHWAWALAAIGVMILVLAFVAVGNSPPDHRR